MTNIAANDNNELFAIAVLASRAVGSIVSIVRLELPIEAVVMAVILAALVSIVYLFTTKRIDPIDLYSSQDNPDDPNSRGNAC